MARVALISLYDEFCLGLRHVAGYVAQHGHDVTLIHFKRYARTTAAPAQAESDASWVKMVTPFGPEILNVATPFSPKEIELLIGLLAKRKVAAAGISVPSNHKAAACAVTRAIADRLRLPVIWGGVHPTIAPDDCLESERALAGVCLADGETAFCEFLDALDRGGDPMAAPIAGMWFRAGDRISRNEPRPVAQDLDGLGMQFFDAEAEFMVDEDRVIHRELIDSEVVWKYKVMTGRGCPFHCSFCIHSTIQRRYPDLKRLRRRSPGHVIEELRRAKSRMPHLRMIEFEDDIFTLQPDWLAEFAELYRREIALPFWCYAYPLSVSPAVLQLLKDMGIEYITMGIQSGSDRINAEVYERRTPKERILDAVRLIGEARIPAVYDIICDNPYESEDDLFETLDVITQIVGEFHLHLTRLAFLPATAITERAARDGLIGKGDDPLHRFYDGLFMLAQYRLGDRESLLHLARDPFFRANPQLLWDAARQAALARMERTGKERAEQQQKTVEERLRAVEADARAVETQYEALHGRRVVRWSTAVADAVRGIVRAFLGN